MLTKLAARRFFVVGTTLCFGAFVLLTLDTLQRIPAQTRADQMTGEVIRGKHLWESSNCMGCHTLLGEGGYYAPELTKVYERRGPAFIEMMLRDPQAMYPGRRQMQRYDFTDTQRGDLVAFLQWIGQMDLNGFPPAPTMAQATLPAGVTALHAAPPRIFSQMCMACHQLDGQGGKIGPALDGVGSRISKELVRSRLLDPKSVKADSLMPKLPLGQAQIDELVEFLAQQQTKGAPR